MSANSLAILRKNAAEDIKNLAEQHLKHDLQESDRDNLKEAGSKFGQHALIGSVFGFGLGVFLAIRLRSARTQMFNAFRAQEKPTHVKFADGREEAIPDLTSMLKPTTLGDIATYFFFSMGGLFVGGETGALTGSWSASRTLSRDPASQKRINDAFQKFRADVLRKQADDLDGGKGLAGILGI